MEEGGVPHASGRLTQRVATQSLPAHLAPVRERVVRQVERRQLGEGRRVDEGGLGRRVAGDDGGLGQGGRGRSVRGQGGRQSRQEFKRVWHQLCNAISAQERVGTYDQGQF